MVAPGNYVQWISIIKRYIDTKSNNENIHYCLQNPPYKFKWAERTIPVAEDSSETTTEGYMENYKNVSQDIRNQLDTEAEVVQIILTRIDNDIYSTVDTCPNAFFTLITTRMAKNEVNEIRAERLARTANPLALIAQQQPVYHPQNHHTHYTQNSSTRPQQATTKNRGKAIVNSPSPTYDQEPKMVAKDDALSKEKEIDKIMALISLSFKKIYKPTNNNLRTSSNIGRENQDNTPRINKGTGYDNQRAVNVVRARENVGTQVVQKSRIQCYNCKEYGNVARECQKPKRAKDAAYHKEKMLLYVGYNSRPIFDAEPLQKVQNDDNNYNAYANDREHPEQPESVNIIYLNEQGDTNITIDSLDMSNNGGQADHDENEYLAKECDLLVFLIEKLKCEIDENKDRNKLLESSNKTLVGKLKSEIKDYKNKNKCLESSNNHLKEANTELAKNSQLMFKDLKKFQAELDSFVKPEFLKKAQRVNPLLYNIGCNNDNLALMLEPESDETIRIA
ncbi:integrase, catalytic region, zinc finger, CCHC-type containing protein [Tanacetum coccineum]